MTKKVNELATARYLVGQHSDDFALAETAVQARYTSPVSGDHFITKFLSNFCHHRTQIGLVGRMVEGSHGLATAEKYVQ